MAPFHTPLQHDPNDFLKHAVSVAHHYGFVPAEHIVRQARRLHPISKKQRSSYCTTERVLLDPFTCELHAAMGMYVVENLSALPQPVMFYHSNASDGALGRDVVSYRTVSRNKPIHFNVQVIGTPHSIAEALVTKVSLEILDELNMKNMRVHVNGIGDRAVLQQFTKELQWFFRKHINDFSPDEQQQIKNDPIGFYRTLHRMRHHARELMPTTLEYLSEASRKHLWEVLEYFERTGIEYEIDPSLVAPRHYTDIMIEIHPKADDGADEQAVVGEMSHDPLARGGRYNDLGQGFCKQIVPAAGMIITCASRASRVDMGAATKKAKNPRIYLVHLGFEAKVKSLEVLEILRRAHIPSYQSLGATTFASQLETAESLRTPYVFIVGYKEAMERTIIIRDMNTRSQEVIPVEMLSSYVKQLRFNK